MFQELFKLLQKCDSISMSIAPSLDGQMTVSVIPNVSGNNMDEALKMRLTLTATPEEFDEGFIAALNSYTTKRTSLADQVEVTNTLLDAAKKESEKKATKALTKSGNSDATNSIGADDDEDDAAGGAPEISSTQSVPVVADAATESSSLWG